LLGSRAGLLDQLLDQAEQDRGAFLDAGDAGFQVTRGVVAGNGS
jgi:hypothetical protein